MWWQLGNRRHGLWGMPSCISEATRTQTLMSVTCSPSCHLMQNSYNNPRGSHDYPLLQGQKENVG